jgi:hypothetical protein
MSKGVKGGAKKKLITLLFNPILLLIYFSQVMKANS